jgi:hypothetical protein
VKLSLWTGDKARNLQCALGVARAAFLETAGPAWGKNKRIPGKYAPVTAEEGP